MWFLWSYEIVTRAYLSSVVRFCSDPLKVAKFLELYLLCLKPTVSSCERLLLIKCSPVLQHCGLIAQSSFFLASCNQIHYMYSCTDFVLLSTAASYIYCNWGFPSVLQCTIANIVSNLKLSSELLDWSFAICRWTCHCHYNTLQDFLHLLTHIRHPGNTYLNLQYLVFTPVNSLISGWTLPVHTQSQTVMSSDNNAFQSHSWVLQQVMPHIYSFCFAGHG